MFKQVIIIALCLLLGVQGAGATSVGTIKEVTEQCEKQAKQFKYKGKMYTVYKGSRGGYFICVTITRGANKGKVRRQYITKEFKA